MLLTSWVRTFAEALKTQRQGVRRKRYRNHSAWHFIAGQRSSAETLERRELLTALVVDQAYVDARNGFVNIGNVDLDINSDGTPEFDSIVVDTVQISGAGTGININLRDLQLERIALKQLTINGVGVDGVGVSLNNVDLASFVIESSNITSDQDPGVQLSLLDVELPELTIYQSVITGGFGPGVTIDLTSDTRNARIAELDIAQSTIDGVAISATGKQLQVFDVNLGADDGPLEVVAVDHNLQPGTEVTITGVTGLPAANTRDTLTPVDENTFTLDNTSSSAGGVYISGGSIDVTTTLGSVRIMQNTITGTNGRDGLEISLNRARTTNLAIENNISVKSIDVTLVDAPQDGVIFRNNTIDATVPQVDGLHFNLTRSSLSNVSIERNNVVGNAVSGGEGIVIESVDSNVFGTIVNNTISDTLGDGIKFTSSPASDSFIQTNRGPLLFEFSGFTAETPLTSNLSTTTTSIPVVDGRAFQSQQIIRIDDELMFVVSVTENTLNVVRGEKGTLATKHSTGTAVRSVTSALSGTRRSISGNLIQNNSGAGLSVNFATGTTINSDLTTNRFIGNRARGIDITVKDTHAQSANVARGGISRTASTLTVTDASPFNNITLPFNVQIDAEQLTVTSITGNTLSVTRGVAGTSASFHDSNTPVYAVRGDAFDINIGSSSRADANIFTSNTDDAIHFELQDEAAGKLQVRNNIITLTQEAQQATGPASPGSDDAHGISIILTGTEVTAEATAILRKSTISDNLIGAAAVTTLASTITTATTVFTVTDPSIFAVNTNVRIDGEEMRITNINPTTRAITVTRAQAGTIAQPHAANSLIVPIVGGNEGRGINVFFDESTAVEDLQITNNVITNNQDDGIRIRREDDGASRTVNPAPGQERAITIAGNTINRNATNPIFEVLDPGFGNFREFGAGIELYAVNGNADPLDVEIRDNRLISNRRANSNQFTQIVDTQSSGVSSRAEADAQIIVDIINNDITFNEGNGVYYTTREESPTDQRDIGGLVIQNTISFNDRNGIDVSARHGINTLLAIGRDGKDATGASFGNLIENNGDHGIEINHGGRTSIVNNDINFSGRSPSDPAGNIPVGTRNVLDVSTNILGSGVFVNNNNQNQVVSTQRELDLVIDKNRIRSNLAMGIDLNAQVFNGDGASNGIQFASNLFATIRNNLITANINDGIELSGAMNATLLGNFVDSNRGRGLDVMNYLTSSSNYQVGNGLESGRNTFVGNGQEGVYYVNTAGAQDQNVFSDNANATRNDGLNTSLPDAILQIDTNTISDNGINSNLSAAGLVMRIGSSGAALNGSISRYGALNYQDNRPGTANSIGTVEGGTFLGGIAASGVHAVNARTNARVTNNDFEGNFGDDVMVRPFISSMPTLITGSNWGRAESPQFSINGTTDPLSRLNLVFQGNTGNGQDVISNTFFAYTDSDPVFKSRDADPNTQTNGNDDDTDPPGPLAGGRPRSITLSASRMDQGLVGSPFSSGFLLSPFAPDTQILQPIDVTRASDIIDVSGGDTTDLLVTTSTAHGLVSGDNVQIAGVRAITSAGAAHIHTANGFWDVSVVDATRFTLRNSAGHGGPVYSSSGRVFYTAHELSYSFQSAYQYPGIGPSTIRIAHGFDTSGTSPQNEFQSGDNFTTQQNHAYESWNPLKALGGVITSIQSVGGRLRITSPNHGLGNNRYIRIDGVTGTERANSTVVRVSAIISADEFEINVPEDDAYISGGEWQTLDDSFPAPRTPTFPVPDVSNVNPDPRAQSAGVVTISYTEPVTNIDIDDFILKRDGVPVDISSLSISQISPTQFTIDLSSVTADEGFYEFTQDNLYPLATMAPVTPNSLDGPVGVITVDFSENVTGVDITDFVLQRDVGDGKGFVPINITHNVGIDGAFGANLVVTQLSPKQYAIDLTSVSDTVGQYRFSLLAPRADTTVAPVTRVNSLGSPVVIRSQNAHGLSTGQTVELENFITPISTSGSLNGQRFRITVIDQFEFQLEGTNSNGVATSGGFWRFDPKIIDEVGHPYGVDEFGVVADTTQLWSRVNSLPTADIIDVSPDPRAIPVSEIVVQFSEPVRIANVNATDFRLTRDVGFNPVPVNLNGTAVIVPVDADPTNTFASTFRLSNIATLTSLDGKYRVSLITTDTSRITDRQGSFLQFPAIDDWTMVTTGPTPDIVDVFPDPRNLPVDVVTFVFNTPVTGVDLNDANTHFTLTRDAGDGRGPQVVPLVDRDTNLPLPIVQNNATSYELNLVSVTGDSFQQAIDGAYQLRLKPNSGIRRVSNGNELVVDAVDSWVQDGSNPVADILDIDPSPRIQNVGLVEVTFNESVTGVDRFNAATDFELTLDIGDGNGPQSIALDGLSVLPIAPVTFAGVAVANPFDLVQTVYSSRYIIDLSALTAVDGTYQLRMRASGAIVDRSGNAFVETDASVDSWVLLPKVVDNSVVDSVYPRLPAFLNPSLPVPNFRVQTNLIPNRAVSDEVDRFFVDGTAPDLVSGTVSITPDPRSTSVGVVTIEFTEPVTGVNLSDLVLRRDSVNVPLTNLVLNAESSSKYSIDLNLVTGAPGKYEFFVQSSGSLIRDFAGNDLQGGLRVLDSWVVENIGPSASIVATARRTTPANDISIEYTKPIRVADFGVNDLRLERDTGTGLVSIPTTTGSITAVGAVGGFARRFNVNLSAAGLTDVPGQYRLTLVARDSGIVDQAGIELAADSIATWELDNRRPIADIVDVFPDPLRPGTNAGIVNVLFSEDVTGVVASDFTLTRNNVPVAIPPELFKQETARRYTLDLTTITQSDGTYRLRLGNTGVIRDIAGNLLVTGALAAAIGPTDGVITLTDVGNFPLLPNFDIRIDSETMRVTGINGNQFSVVRNISGGAASHAVQSAVSLTSDLTLGASDTWFQGDDTLAPTVSIGAITTPRNTPAGIVTITFDEPVSGVDLSDFILTRNGVPVPLSGPGVASSVVPFPGSDSIYLLDLTDATFSQGTYSLTVAANRVPSPIVDNAMVPNAFTTSVSATWVNQLIDPSASFVSVTPSPRLRPVGEVTVNFSQPVRGVDVSDFRLTRDGQQVSLRGVEVKQSPSGAAQYTIDLSAVTGSAGQYRLSLVAANSSITQVDTGNPLLSDALTTWETRTEITVTTTRDFVDSNPGDGFVANTSESNISLRSAVMEAGRLAGDDTIVVPEGIYTLSIGGSGEQFAASGDLDIFDTTGTTTIRGAGAGKTIIDAGQLERIFHITSGARFILDGVTVRNGQVVGSEDGGAIRNDSGNVEIRNSVITDNRSLDDGGAINNDGTMLIVNSTLTRNQATNSGGAIRNVGSLRVENSLIGGVYTPSTTPIVDNRNKAGVAGGGIANLANGTVTIVNSTISGNAATNPTGNGGGISNQAPFPNIGGLLAANLSAVATTLLVADPTVFPNQEVFDVRIDNEDVRVTRVTNSTFTITRGVNGTVAAPHLVGSTVTVRSNLNLVNVTIDNNQASGLGGGLHVTNGRTLVENTIFGLSNSSTVPTNGPDVWNNNSAVTIVNLGGNVVSRNNGATVAFPIGATVGSTNAPVDPRINALGDNGGPTLTHGLLLGSPAINFGVTQFSQNDQRGITRVLTTVDAGAVEFGGFFIDSLEDSTDVLPGDGIVADRFGRKTLRAAVMESNALAGPNAIKLGEDQYNLTIESLDRTAPTVDIVDVNPDPLQDKASKLQPVDQVVLQFSEPVFATTAQILAQLQLIYTPVGGVATNLSLAGATITRDVADITKYEVNGLRTLLSNDGLYEFRFVTAPGITDFENNLLIADPTTGILGVAALEQFTRGEDKFAPTASLVAVNPDPRTTAPDPITLNFNEPVVGINLSSGAPQFSLTFDDGTGPVSVSLASAIVQQVTQSQYTLDLSNVSINPASNAGLNQPGVYVLRFDPLGGGGAVRDIAQNDYLGGVLSDTWLVQNDTIAPTADILDVTPDPRIGVVGTVSIRFDEGVVGIDTNSAETHFDLTLDVDGPGPQVAMPIDISALSVIQIDDANYEIDLSDVTTRDGFYTLTLNPTASSTFPIFDTAEATVTNPTAPNQMVASASESFVIGDDVARFTVQGLPIPNNGMSLDDAASFGDLDITSGELILIGSSSTTRSRISGSDIDRVLDVYAGATLRLVDIDILDGFVANGRDGAGIRGDDLGIAGTITIDVSGSSLESNDASGGRGGAIFSNGDVTVVASQLSSNSAAFGGAIFNESGTVTIDESIVTGNSTNIDGGAVFNDRNGDLALTGVTIRANTAGRHGGGIYNNDSAIVIIIDSTLTSNRSTDDGGAVFNELAATLTIDNSTFASNHGRSGGAIFDQDGVVDISRSALSANTADQDGGAVFVTSSGVVRISQSTLSGNLTSEDGGAISNDGTLTLDVVSLVDNTAGDDRGTGNGGAIYNTRSLALINSSVQGNTAIFDGGALLNAGNGTATISGSTLSGNVAGSDGGSIFNTSAATLTITQSTVADSSAGGLGGGIYSDSTGGVSFVNSTNSGNRANQGGGFYNARSLTLSNSTVSSNTATQQGGGIYNTSGTITSQSTTIFANRGSVGGGIFNATVFGPVNLKNTIVAMNVAGSNPDVSGSQFVSQGNNLIGNIGTVTSITSAGGNIIGTSLVPIDPLLGELQDNGGPTKTHSLLFGSPARDKGSNVGVAATDQRGFARIFDGDGNGTATVDIGSFESGFIVNSFLDTVDVNPGDLSSADHDGNSSLRAAVMEANALDGDDTILLLPGTYQLTIAGRDENGASQGDLDVTTDSLTVIGSGTEQTIIDAAELDRVFHVAAGAKLNLKNLTITGGISLLGGGVLNQGTITLENVVVTGNQADFGGGIYNDQVSSTLVGAIGIGNLTLQIANPAIFPSTVPFDFTIGTERVRVTNVSTVGAVTTYTVARGINGTTPSNHAAGAKVTMIGEASVIDSTISGNEARLQGGGIFNRNPLTLTGTVVSANDANSQGGGLYNTGSAAIDTSTFDGNETSGSGGAIYNDRAVANEIASITVTNTTLSANSAGVKAGAIYNNDIVTLLNSTLSGNSAAATGGAIFNTPTIVAGIGSVGSILLTNVTVVLNSTDGVGGGIVNLSPAGSAVLRNTVVSGNTAEKRDVDVSGAFTSSGANFIGDAGTSTGFINLFLGDQVGTTASPFDAVFGPLAFNGGPTRTHALLSGSPAIDSGDNSGGEPVDQRNGQRPTDNTADVGAFEVQENFVSISDVELAEGDTGSTLFVFAVLLEKASAEPVSVRFATEADTAKTGSDFIGQSGTVTFAPGELIKTIVIEVNGDISSEAGITADVAEHFFVRLSSPTNAVIRDAVARGAILNDDSYVFVSNEQVVEGDSGQVTSTFTITLDVPSIFPVTVNYATVDATATAGGGDYVATSGSLLFAVGETSKTVTVVTNGDTSLEGFETYLLRATSAFDENGDAIAFGRQDGVGTILNDEVSILISDAASVVEGNGTTTTPLDFTVSLAQPVGVAVTVDVATNSATAIGNSDYQSKTQTLTFSPNAQFPALPGDVSKTFTVNVNGDSRFEPNEQFTVTLSNATRGGVAFGTAVLDPTPAVGTIMNDDPAPNQWLIQRNGAGTAVEVYLNSVLQTTTAGLVAPLVVTGTATDDVFTVDFVNGDPVPSGGLTIDGALEVGGDSLVITDSSGVFSATNVIYTATGGESGTVAIDSSVITYSELEPIVDKLVAANRTVNLTPNVAHQFQIVDDTAVAGNSLVSSLISPATFESISFFNPTTSLTVNAGTLGDTATVQSLDPAFAASFTLNAGGGDDVVDASVLAIGFVLNGGDGEDQLGGGTANDTINGGAGADELFGNGGDDLLRGHDAVTADDSASDTVDGGSGNDQVFGQLGNDSLQGGNGLDTIDGGDGVDSIFGGFGNDSLLGGDGTDSISGEDGDDFVDGQGGNDTIGGGIGADNLNGGADDDSILGGDGNDTLNGGTGNDFLGGEAGNDSLLGGADNDTVDGGAGTNVLNGEAGVDRIDLLVVGTAPVVLSNSALTISGSPTSFLSIEEFKFIGDGEANFVDASTYSLGAVTILGNAGNDTLRGGGGADSIDGGLGNDSLNGNGGNDSILGNTGNDVIDGGDGADTILGNTGSDSISGGVGNDSIVGGVGLDTIQGGEGNDTLSGDEDADSLFGDGGNDFITAGTAADIVFGGLGNDQLYGGDGNDTISADDGDDFVLGDNDNDSLIGGLGNDTMLGAAGNDSVVTGLGNDFVDGQGSSDVMQVADGTAGGDTYSLTYSSGFLNLAKTSGTAFSVVFRRTEVVVLNTVGGADVFTTGNLAGSIDSVIVQLSLGEGDDSLNAAVNTNSLITFQVNGGLGNDSLVAGNSRTDAGTQPQGRNVLEGDFGNDFIVGGSGNDSVVGGEGNDSVFGGSGNDTIVAGVGDDYIRGNGGNDSVSGGDGNDYIKGDAGNDILLGDNGNDRIAGDLGNDAIYAGNGDDTVRGDGGNDYIDGGAGNDLIRGDDFTQVGAGADRIVGGLGRDVILGDDGNDTLAGNNDPDVVIGGAGIDSIQGNGGFDTLTGGSASDTPSPVLDNVNFILDAGEVDNAFILASTITDLFKF